MTEKIRYEVDTGSSLQTLKDLQKSIRESRATMLTAEEGTEEWTRALQTAADAQHRLNETNRMIRASAMDLGAVLQNTTQVLGGVAGGFNAVQGVMALVSEDNEMLMQTMVRLQAGMAIVQGINGLDGMIKGFQNLNIIMKSTRIGTIALTAVQKIWNAVMAVNPIFLIITALAAATAGIIALTRVLRRNSEEQKNSNRLLEEYNTLREETNYLNDLELKYMKARGASEEELYQTKLKNLELDKASVSMEILRLEAKRKLNKEEKKQLEEAQDQYEKLELQIRQTYDAERVRRVAEETRRLADEEKERERAAADAEKRREEALAKRNQDLEREKQLQAELAAQEEDRRQREVTAQLELSVIREKNFENQRALLERNKELELQNQDLTESERLIIIENYEIQFNQLRLEYGRYTADELLEIEREKRQTQLEEERHFAEQLQASANEWAIQNEELSWEQQKIRILERFEEEKALLEAHGLDITDLRAKMEADLTEVIRQEEQERQQIYQQGLNQVMGVYNSIDNIVMDSYEARINAAEGNEAKQEALRKKAFKANQSFEIANTIITGLFGVVNALSAKTLIPEPVGSILKAANAVAIGVATAANVSKIKSQRYSGSGGSTGGASAGSIAAGISLPSAPVLPFDIEPVRNIQTEEEIDLQRRPMKAYVVETELRETQNNIDNINDESTL